MWSLLIPVLLLGFSSTKWSAAKAKESCAICENKDGKLDCESCVICENKYGKLDCGSSTIQIHAANYGRTSKTICTPEYNNINCHATKSTEIVRQQCEGKTNCCLKPTNAMFRDPCSGTSKYLNISYSCVPPSDLQFVAERLSWLDALAYCAKNGSRLVHILDNGTQASVVALLRAASCRGRNRVATAWVGLERCMINPHAPWEWSGGAAVGGYTHWRRSFPRSPCSFHCGQLQEERGDYLWQDACCQEKHPFICQFQM